VPSLTTTNSGANPTKVDGIPNPTKVDSIRNSRTNSAATST
jgi:hypothetical protein